MVHLNALIDREDEWYKYYCKDVCGIVPLEALTCFDSYAKAFSVSTTRALHAGALPEIQYRTRLLIV